MAVPGVWVHRISIHALREEGDRGRLRGCCGGSYFYPRPPRGGRLAGFGVVLGGLGISIHALREEGDSFPSPPLWGTWDFYPRPPRGGRPLSIPAWAARCYFYPRPPRGGRRVPLLAPVLESLFLSTPSARRATASAAAPARRLAISIHALREEGDTAWPARALW